MVEAQTPHSQFMIRKLVILLLFSFGTSAQAAHWALYSSTQNINCSGFANGGKLTTNGADVFCTDDTSGGGGGGSLPLPPGDTNYIQNRTTLQTGTTAYPDFIYNGSSATINKATFLNQTGFGGASTASTNAGIDILSGGLGIVGGADNSASTRTNNTTHNFRIAGAPYTNAASPIGMIYSSADGTDNYVNLGGGSSQLTAATIIRFFVAPNNNTISGTELGRFTATGLNISTNTSLTNLSVSTTSTKIGTGNIMTRSSVTFTDEMIVTTSSSPSLNPCGVSTLEAGSSNSVGIIDFSGSLLTSCTLNFSLGGFTTKPACVCNTSSALSLPPTLSTTATSFTYAAQGGGGNLSGTLDYHCFGIVP